MIKSKRLKYKIDDVLRIHLPYNLWEYELGEDYDGDEEEKTILCQVCEQSYPCLTVQILRGKW